MVVDVAEYERLPERISTEALELIWAGGERGDGLGVALPEPLVRPPPQGLEDPPHLFIQEQDLLTPAGLACACFRPLKSKP